MKDSYIIEFKGKIITLNLNNIKEVYFSSYCNKVCFSNEVKDFLEQHIDYKIVLEWNNEFVNINLDKIDELLNKNSFDTIRDICYYFELILDIYFIEKRTYARIIESLKIMFNKFGYFMNYNFFDVNPDCNIFKLFNFIYIRGLTVCSEYLSSVHGSILYYLKNIKYLGLLPQLYYLNYFDLFWKCIDEIIIPIYEHFNEPSKYLKDNNLKYDDDLQSLKKYRLKITIDDFIKENHIKR